MKNIDVVQEVGRMTGVNPRKCMRCGKCSAVCPAYEEMDIHPHQFVAMMERGAVEELMESRAIWNCLSCMACLERCPPECGACPVGGGGPADGHPSGGEKPFAAGSASGFAG